MTLAEVAARLRRQGEEWHGDTEGSEAAHTVWDAVEAFEADPDFTLRERVEDLARREVSLCSMGVTPGDLHLRKHVDLEHLLALLNPPEKEGT